MTKILLVEDDKDFATALSDWLKSEHTVEATHDGAEAFELLKQYKYDVIILDWEVPNKSGIDICNDFRNAGGATPILMLTGRSDLAQKEEGLNLGADDYVTKPAQLREISARVRALIRRAAGMTSNLLKIRDLEIDPNAHTVKKSGKQIALLPREFAVIEYLVRHRQTVFSAEELLRCVWSSDVDASPHTVASCINRLRNKIDTAGEPSIIRTIYSVGYVVD